MCTKFDIYELHGEADKNYVTGRTKLYIYLFIHISPVWLCYFHFRFLILYLKEIN